MGILACSSRIKAQPPSICPQSLNLGQWSPSHFGTVLSLLGRRICFFFLKKEQYSQIIETARTCVTHRLRNTDLGDCQREGLSKDSSAARQTFGAGLWCFPESAAALAGWLWVAARPAATRLSAASKLGVGRAYCAVHRETCWLSTEWRRHRQQRQLLLCLASHQLQGLGRGERERMKGYLSHSKGKNNRGG